MKHFKLLAILAMLSFQVLTAQNTPVRKTTTKTDYSTSTSAAQQKAAATENEEEGEWKSLGTGQYRDDYLTAFYLVDFYEFDVEIEENTNTPGLYRIVSPYKSYPMDPAEFEGDTYMEIDATNPDAVYIKKYDTGVDWGNGNIIIFSIAGDYMEQYGSLDRAINENLCGKLTDGSITFPISSLLIRDGSIPEGKYSYANRSGMFRVKLPGALDLDVSMTLEDELVEVDGNQFVSTTFTLGESIEKMKIAMVPGEYEAGVEEGIIDGSIASVEVTSDGEVLFPFTADGVHTFVAVPYNSDMPKTAQHFTKDFMYVHEGWKDLGRSVYTEAFMSDSEVDMGVDAVDISVLTQESTETPGIYRLVDPYGLDYAYSSELTYDLSHHYFLVIDASDPDRVVIKKMENCGLIINVGRSTLWSVADRYLSEGQTVEEVEAKGVFGKKEGNVITFPEKALYITFPDVIDPALNLWYRANLTNKFRLVLPGDTGIEETKTADESENAEVEYYTVNGVKVSNPTAPGIYIKKQGSKVTKFIKR